MSKKNWFQQVCCCKSSFIILIIYKNRDCLYDKYAMVLHESGYTRSCTQKQPENFQTIILLSKRIPGIFSHNLIICLLIFF